MKLTSVALTIMLVLPTTTYAAEAFLPPTYESFSSDTDTYGSIYTDAIEQYKYATKLVGEQLELKNAGQPTDFNKALYYYQKSADQGYVPALHMVGIMYMNCVPSISKNPAKALSWFQKAADQNENRSQFVLGKAYFNGSERIELPVEKDINKAIYWLKKSADQNNSEAQNMLGNIYTHDAEHQDYDAAFDLYKKSALSNDSGSQISLGRSYEEGRGTTKNIVEAYAWYLVADANPTTDPITRDIIIKKYRTDLEPKLTFGNVADAKKLALQYITLINK